MKIIKEKYEIELRREYSKENFENIIKFVKTHNVIYGGEILENILLKLFSSIMKIPQKETINKYIYYNLQNVFGIKNKMIQKQIKLYQLRTGNQALLSVIVYLYYLQGDQTV